MSRGAIAVILLASLIACKALVSAPGGNMMTMNALVQFHETDLLEDVGAVAAGDKGYLVTVEHSYESVESPLNVPSERTTWRFWEPGTDGTTFREASRSTIPFPMAKSVVMTLTGKGLAALAQVNEPKPAFLFLWDTAPGTVPRLADAATKWVPVELDQPEAAQVRVNPAHNWSTRGLQTSRWLFHPSLTSLPGGETVAVSMNTAGGHAVVWTSAGVETPKRPLLFLAGALNPVFIRTSGSYLFYRRASGDWPVFFRDTRYSGQYGPVALPLMMADVDSAGMPVRSTDLSNVRGIGHVFDFAVAGGDRTAIALAVIAGSKKEPQLRIYALEGPDSLRLRQSVALRGVPYRLTMAALRQSILIGLAHKGQNNYQVEGFLLPW